jgi:hypothetical protein
MGDWLGCLSGRTTVESRPLQVSTQFVDGFLRCDILNRLSFCQWLLARMLWSYL